MMVHVHFPKLNALLFDHVMQNRSVVVMVRAAICHVTRPLVLNAVINTKTVIIWVQNVQQLIHALHSSHIVANLVNVQLIVNNVYHYSPSV